MRPPGPEPSTFPRSTPLSTAILRATLVTLGSTTATLEISLCAGTFSLVVWIAAGDAALLVFLALAPAGRAAFSSMRATTAPTFRSSPVCAATLSTPEAVAKMSSVALSLSISVMTSSFSTHSPSPRFHAPRRTSEMLSPGLGITMSIIQVAPCLGVKWSVLCAGGGFVG